MKLSAEEIQILQRKGRSFNQIAKIMAIEPVQSKKLKLPRSNRTSNPIDLLSSKPSPY
jgi:hypothetical protein